VKYTALLFLLLWCTAGAAAEVRDVVRGGDIIFQTSKSAQSEAIQRATKSPYSHMGLILLRDGKPFVLEASATVKFTPLDEWIARGIAGHYVVKRLSTAPRGLPAEELESLTAEAKHFEKKPYDLAFEWTDKRIYCSELVWKIYQRALKIELGPLARLRDFDLTDSVVAAKVRERYGNRVPLDEKVISPAAIFDSKMLTTVAKE
jgi:hypothetical protein